MADWGQNRLSDEYRRRVRFISMNRHRSPPLSRPLSAKTGREHMQQHAVHGRQSYSITSSASTSSLSGIWRPSAIRLARESSDRALRLADIARVDQAQLHAQRRRHGLDSTKHAARGARGGIPNYRCSRHVGRDLLEERHLERAGVDVAQDQVGRTSGVDRRDARELPIQADRADEGGAADEAQRRLAGKDGVGAGGLAAPHARGTRHAGGGRQVCGAGRCQDGRDDAPEPVARSERRLCTVCYRCKEAFLRLGPDCEGFDEVLKATSP